MKTQWKQIAVIALFIGGLLPAFAQTAAIDPALLAKANGGDAAAQVKVGESCAAGSGAARTAKQLAEDYRQAAEWYKKAALQGDAGAQATLGVLYSVGQGVAHSDVEAYYWLDLAAAVKGANQEKYAANRQMIGTHITAEELEAVQERVEQWKAAHPR